MSESKLRKHRLKREICLLSIFIAIYPIHYVECRQTLLDLNSLEAYPSLCPPKNKKLGVQHVVMHVVTARNV